MILKFGIFISIILSLVYLYDVSHWANNKQTKHYMTFENKTSSFQYEKAENSCDFNCSDQSNIFL